MSGQNTYHDQDHVAVIAAVSSADGVSIVLPWADPVTHRLLTTGAGGGGLTQLAATGTVNGVNAAFTFTQEPTYIISDGAWYPPVDSLGTTNWTWNGGTLTATTTIPPVTFIGGVLFSSSITAIYADTISGIINGSNRTFTVLNTIIAAMTLYLAGMPYQPGVDFTTSGMTITMVTAPDSSLSGQPFWLLHT